MGAFRPRAGGWSFQGKWLKSRHISRSLCMAFEGLMKGKRGLIMGVANDRSIAWGVAKVLSEAGASLAFTYQGDVFKKRVLPLVEPLKPAALIDCDVSSQASIDAAFADLRKVWDRLDFMVHAIGFSDKE